MLKADAYLCTLEGNIVQEAQLQRSTNSHLVNNVGLELIQETLERIIVRQEMYLKNLIGEACGYKLSTEQWQIAEQLTNAPVIVVPPGSGKKLLCCHCLREKGSKNECLYVCTTNTLAAFMASLVKVVRSDAELRTMIESEDYDNKTIIAFDDALFSCSGRTIENLLELVTSNPGVRL